MSNNQETKADLGKPHLTLVPNEIIRVIAVIREYGNKKYGDPENWRTVEIDRFRNAAYRHLLAYIDNPNAVDSESGYPHLWHLACNVAFLCEMEKKKSIQNLPTASEMFILCKESGMSYDNAQVYITNLIKKEEVVEDRQSSCKIIYREFDKTISELKEEFAHLVKIQQAINQITKGCDSNAKPNKS